MTSKTGRAVTAAIALAVATTGSAAIARAEALPAPLMAPPADKGQVVFFRRGGLFGAAISCGVHLNGNKITRLPPGKFAALTVAPGVHEFSVKSEATDKLRMEVEPGETYFAECSIGMGVMAGRPNLTPVDVSAFAARAKKLKPVKAEDMKAD